MVEELYTNKTLILSRHKVKNPKLKMGPPSPFRFANKMKIIFEKLFLKNYF
jgi:hypothetical protein